MVDATKNLPRQNLKAFASQQAKRFISEEDMPAFTLIGAIIRQHSKRIIAVLFLSLGVALFESNTLALFGLAISSLNGSTDTFADALGPLAPLIKNIANSMGEGSFFILVIALAAAAQVLRGVIEFLNNVLTNFIRSDVESDLKNELYEQYVRMSYAEFTQYRLGDLSVHLNQTMEVGEWLRSVRNGLLNSVTALGYLLLMLILSWQLTIITFAFFIPVGWVVRTITKRVRRNAQSRQNARKTLHEIIFEYLQGSYTVRTLALEDESIKQVESKVEEGRVALRQGFIWQDSLGPIMNSISVISVSAFLVGIYVFSADETGALLSTLLTFIAVLWRMFGKVVYASNDLANMGRYWPSLGHISNLLDTRDREYLVSGERQFEQLNKHIEFRSVTMRYKKAEQPAIDDLSFTIPKGKITAFVGESGAGKSTIIDLVLRLYDPTGGQVLVNDETLKSFDVRSWREKIEFVQQDPFLFNASIRDNIALGHPGEATEEEIIAAAKMANAHEFIVRQDDGYDTSIGENGGNLSGGQRQRLALARALVRGGEILILDEATSNLDSESERLIQEALKRTSTEKTVLIIAHRLSTISHADQILVMQKGKIMEQGTHEELLALDKHYARYWRLQSS